MLIGKILHSPHPHARIKSIDTSRARALPGVVAVVTGKDAPTTYGILPIGHDEHALALDKVRYVGDNVACVAAVDEATAEKALELIDVEYELLPAWFDPEQSMKAESDFIHQSRPHNIEKEYHHVFGDPDKAFAEADYVAEARYIANEVTHAAMEPHSTLASFELDPHTGKPGAADGVVVHAGAVLPAAQAVAGAGHADVADSRDQAAGGRRLRRQERSDPAGNHGGNRGARGQRSGEDHLHARGSFLGASRAPAHHRRSENRREERRAHRRRGSARRPGRRRVLLLWRR